MLHLCSFFEVLFTLPGIRVALLPRGLITPILIHTIHSIALPMLTPDQDELMDEGNNEPLDKSINKQVSKQMNE